MKKKDAKPLTINDVGWKPKALKYKVAKGTKPDILEGKVQELLDLGYQPHGNLISLPGGTLLQAMVGRPDD